MLDAVDATLIRELQRDGRATFQSLGEKVGLSRNATRVRVANLLAAGVIRVTGVVDAAVAGLTALGRVGVAVDGDIRPVIEAVRPRRAATFVSLTSGRHPVAVELRARDDSALSAELTFLRELPGVRAVEVFRCVPAGGASTGRPAADLELDGTDWRLIAELQLDGRAAYTELAKRIDMSQTAARTRVVRLVDSGAVRITALVDSAALGLTERVGFGVGVRGDARQTAARISRLPGVTHAIPGFGRYDVMGTADAAGRADLLGTLDAVRALPGVRRLESWHYLAIVKESYSIDVGALPQAGAPGAQGHHG